MWLPVSSVHLSRGRMQEEEEQEKLLEQVRTLNVSNYSCVAFESSKPTTYMDFEEEEEEDDDVM